MTAVLQYILLIWLLKIEGLFHIFRLLAMYFCICYPLQYESQYDV